MKILNRVGTPTFYMDRTELITTEMSGLWVGTDILDSVFPYNVINAAPGSRRDTAQLLWNDTVTLATGKKLSLVHQFTVEQPNDGNAVAVEVQGSFVLPVTVGPLLFAPLIGKLAAAEESQGASGVFAAAPVLIGPPQVVPIAGPHAIGCYWKETILFGEVDQDDVYGVGVGVWNHTGNTTTLAWPWMHSSIRAMNDETERAADWYR